MKRWMKICAWIGGILFVAGGIVFVCGMAKENWAFDRLATLSYSQQDYTADSVISAVNIDYDVCDITVQVDADASFVSCSYPVVTDLTNGNRAEATFRIEDQTLFIQADRLPFSPFQFNLGSSDANLTLTLPNELQSLTVTCDTGNVVLENVALLDSLTVSVNTGNIDCRSVQANSVSLSADLGNIALKTCSAERFDLKGDVSNITLRDITAQTFYADVDLGDIRCAGTISALTAELRTATGNLALNGGLLDVRDLSLQSDLGDVSATLIGAREDYAADVEWDLGQTNIYPSQQGERSLLIRAEIGNIDIQFQKN